MRKFIYSSINHQLKYLKCSTNEVTYDDNFYDTLCESLYPYLSGEDLEVAMNNIFLRKGDKVNANKLVSDMVSGIYNYWVSDLDEEDIDGIDINSLARDVRKGVKEAMARCKN